MIVYTYTNQIYLHLVTQVWRFTLVINNLLLNHFIFSHGHNADIKWEIVFGHHEEAQD